MSKAEQSLTTTFTKPTDHELVAVRTFDAPPQAVWETFVRPEHVSQWMRGLEGWTMPVCEIDLRPGGAWRWVWRKGGEETMELRGEYREIVEPQRLVNTEAWGGDWPETLVTTEFTGHDGRTTVTCTVQYPSKADRDRATETGMLEGWSNAYDRLEEYLRTL